MNSSIAGHAILMNAALSANRNGAPEVRCVRTPSVSLGPSARLASFVSASLRGNPAVQRLSILWPNARELRGNGRNLESGVEHGIAGVQVPGHLRLLIGGEPESEARGLTRLIGDECNRVHPSTRGLGCAIRKVSGDLVNQDLVAERIIEDGHV